MIPRFKPLIGFEELLASFRNAKYSVEDFEKAFAYRFKAREAVAFSYGRTAQWAFFRALGIVDSEVLMPAYTCSVVAHAVTLSGNTPRFVDISLSDFNMNLEELRQKINKKTSAIILTHTFGYPQDLNKLNKIVEAAEVKYRKKIWVVHDCCHCFGAEFDERLVGTYGDVAVYAFNVSKTITSVFGGMLTFNDPEIAHRLKKWRDKNIVKKRRWKSFGRRIYFLCATLAFSKYVYGLTWWLQKQTKILKVFTDAYHLDEQIAFPPDFDEPLSAYEATIGMIQMNRYSRILKIRQAQVDYYQRHIDFKKKRMGFLAWRAGYYIFAHSGACT